MVLSSSLTASTALGQVGHRAENIVAEKSARPLDGMDRTEDAGDQFAVLRLVLKLYDFLVEHGEILVALDQELTDFFIEFKIHCAYHPYLRVPSNYGIRARG
jgi:hypothetical protein